MISSGVKCAAAYFTHTPMLEKKKAAASIHAACMT